MFIQNDPQNLIILYKEISISVVLWHTTSKQCHHIEGLLHNCRTPIVKYAINCLFRSNWRIFNDNMIYFRWEMTSIFYDNGFHYMTYTCHQILHRPVIFACKTMTFQANRQHHMSDSMVNFCQNHQRNSERGLQIYHYQDWFLINSHILYQ